MNNLHVINSRSPTRRSNTHHCSVPAGSDSSDSRLVRCAQSGESGAFDQLVLKYRPRVLELAMRYTRNKADAEDAAQDAFIKAYRGLQHFRCESTFYTWLYRIAKNVLQARGRVPIDGTVGFSDDPDATHHPSQLRELDTPEGLTVIDDMRGMVNAALETLSEVHRTAIILREIDGLSYKQIAAAMAIPVGTVRSRVFRAREFIDHQLRRVCDSGLRRDIRRDSGHA